VKYGATQKVELNHNEDSLFMVLRMIYCYIGYSLTHRTPEQRHLGGPWPQIFGWPLFGPLVFS